MPSVRLVIIWGCVLGLWVAGSGFMAGDGLFYFRGAVAAAGGLFSMFDVLERTA